MVDLSANPITVAPRAEDHYIQPPQPNPQGTSRTGIAVAALLTLGAGAAVALTIGKRVGHSS